MEPFRPPTEELGPTEGPTWWQLARLSGAALWLALVGLWLVEQGLVWVVAVRAMNGLAPDEALAAARAATAPLTWISAGRYGLAVAGLGMLWWRPPPRGREPSFVLLQVGMAAVAVGALLVAGPAWGAGLSETPLLRWLRVMLELGSVLLLGQLLHRRGAAGWANRASLAALVLGAGRLLGEVGRRGDLPGARVAEVGVSTLMVFTLTLLVFRLVWPTAGPRRDR